MHIATYDGSLLTVNRLLMGGTFNREDNIRGRAIFVLEPGIILNRDQVRNVEKELPPPQPYCDDLALYELREEKSL